MHKETPAARIETLSLRPVGPEDAAFLLKVYSSTRMDEMALVPWTAEQRALFLKMQFDAQLYHYQTNFPTATHAVIELAGQPVGRLYVLRTPKFIRILDITILPDFRNAGSGTQLIEELMSEAAAAHLPLRINVESFNPSLRLFERLGFQKAEENGIHFLMEWNAGSSSTNNTGLDA
jgi:ribosomal protein S18 acetylase RimI-like enzyme